MEVVAAPLAGVMLIKPKVWGDSRGYFVETWQQERYAAAGIDAPFVQDNHSMSTWAYCAACIFKKRALRASL